MSQPTTTRRSRPYSIGLVLLAALAMGLLLVGIGVQGTVHLLQRGLLAVLYLLVPVVVLAGLILVYFRVAAWLD